MLERLRLDDKTAVVTGAGRGLGKAMAKALAQAGAELVCAARTSTQIAATVQEVCAAGGRAIAAAYEEAGARVARLTTLSASAVAQAVKRAAADMGSLQVLASASDRFLAKPVTDITPDDLTEVLTANCALRFPIIRRAGMPADIGPIAVWLAGTGVGYVTGQIFPVDGGLTQHL